MGITCSNTSRLYGNLVDNGFSELNSKHPLAPDDRPAEPNDERVIFETSMFPKRRRMAVRSLMI